MLYKLLFALTPYFTPMNLFRYITFRTALAVLTAAGVSLIWGPAIIRRLKAMQMTQQIRDDGPQAHLSKAGTPTMGGVIIIGSILISVLMWGDLNNRYVAMLLASMLLFGGIGFWDDYLKVSKKNPKGLSAKAKLLMQIVVALAIALLLYFDPNDPYSDVLSVPFFKKWLFHMGVFYVPFAILVIVGSSNAVNLTDGIDGLAIGLVAIATLANGALVYISGHKELSQYLHVLYLPGSGEIAIFCGALFGASLGFLWHNAYPADIFMGDVGSLALGGVLGTLAVISKQEIVLALVGGVFVVEALSVMIQVISFKLTGKRVFRMAPIHHHFELLGWPENRVIVRFWIVGIMLALLSLATLKVR